MLFFGRHSDIRQIEQICIVDLKGISMENLYIYFYRTGHIFVGANVSVACKLPIELTMPHIDLHWHFPHNNEVTDGRIVLGEQQRQRILPGTSLAARHPNSDILLTRAFVIDPVESGDVGDYVCTATVPPSIVVTTNEGSRPTTITASLRAECLRKRPTLNKMIDHN